MLHRNETKHLRIGTKESAYGDSEPDKLDFSASDSISSVAYLASVLRYASNPIPDNYGRGNRFNASFHPTNEVRGYPTREK